MRLTKTSRFIVTLLIVVSVGLNYNFYKRLQTCGCDPIRPLQELKQRVQPGKTDDTRIDELEQKLDRLLEKLEE